MIPKGTILSTEDNIGFVRLENYMGDDLSAVNAARVSMGKRSEALSAEDIKLLSYLADHKHWTPYGHQMITLHIKMPIFVIRQWYRHEVGFLRNEESRRYVDNKPEFFVPQVLRGRAASVKQGSAKTGIRRVLNWLGRGILCTVNLAAYWAYRALLGIGVCPEQARIVLPQSMYTEFWETASLAAYMRLCHQRLDAHAQKEIRDYALPVANICGALFPHSWKANHLPRPMRYR